MDFAFIDPLDFVGKLQDKSVGFVEFSANLGDFPLVLLDIPEQEQRLPAKIKKLLEHGK